MGHTLLGTLPRSRDWHEVIRLIADGAEAHEIAQATIKAAERAFSHVQGEYGYNHAVWLLTQLSLAGKSPNPLEHLRNQGVRIPDNASLPEIVSSFSDAFDAAQQHRSYSDLGELSHRALVDALAVRMKPKLEQRPLFNTENDHLQTALSQFGKNKEFSQLSRAFFARFTDETMRYFLSRTLSSELGANQRFSTMDQLSQFQKALSTHCREASQIVEGFSKEWFSKHYYAENGGISRESVEGFASWALEKMNNELKAGANFDGP